MSFIVILVNGLEYSLNAQIRVNVNFKVKIGIEIFRQCLRD